jgi:phospholipid-translocating ATPase
LGICTYHVSLSPFAFGLFGCILYLFRFQNIVPISLYISIEFVRTLQAAFIYFDKDIWYEKTNQPTLARSWNLSDDLGQIEYIFSDKTGTLTQVSILFTSDTLEFSLRSSLQNSMVFRQCSIGGKVYSGDPQPLNGGGEPEPKPQEPPEPTNNDDLRELQRIPEITTEVRLSNAESSTAAGSGTTQNENAGQASDPVKLSEGVHTHFHDAKLKADLQEAIGADPGSEHASHARSLNGFFTVLALCHTVLSVVDPETGAIEYKAQSPDEAALVQAASDMGFTFLGRDRESLRLRTPFSAEVERYELLNILEFTSARKRMSVVLRKMNAGDERLFLLTKGADNVVFERLKPGADELKEKTEEQLAEFASEGLRTLTLAYKVISGKSCSRSVCSFI